MSLSSNTLLLYARHCTNTVSFYPQYKHFEVEAGIPVVQMRNVRQNTRQRVRGSTRLPGRARAGPSCSSHLATGPTPTAGLEPMFQATRAASPWAPISSHIMKEVLTSGLWMAGLHGAERVLRRSQAQAGQRSRECAVPCVSTSGGGLRATFPPVPGPLFPKSIMTRFSPGFH